MNPPKRIWVVREPDHHWKSCADFKPGFMPTDSYILAPPEELLEKMRECVEFDEERYQEADIIPPRASELLQDLLAHFKVET